MDTAHLWQIDVARAVHFDVGVEVDLAPHPDSDLIARANHIVWGYRDLVDRSKGGGHPLKQVVSVNRKHLPGCRCNQLLELSQRFGRRGNLIAQIIGVADDPAIVNVGRTVLKTIGASSARLRRAIGILLTGIAGLLAILPISELTTWGASIDGIGAVDALLSISARGARGCLGLREG